jgi:hypothetical protein
MDGYNCESEGHLLGFVKKKKKKKKKKKTWTRAIVRLKQVIY